MTISFSMEDLKRSLPAAADLSGLSGAELVEAARHLLGKLAVGADLSINGGVVTLDFGEISEQRVSEAEKLREKAANRATKGEFSKAASSYRRVLELDPTNQSARLELAMVLMESGKNEDATDALLDALKADPRDPKALVILGNHYARQDGQREVAISLIRRACEVAPDDAVAHNSLGALLLESEQSQEAVAEFNETLRIDPTLGNAWYGRSIAEIELRQWATARDTLQSMFALGPPADRRQQQMLAEARDSFRRVTNIIGNDRAPESLKVAEELAARLGCFTGKPVTIRETTLGGTVSSRSHAAWETGKDHHLIELDENLPAEMVKHHLVCRECSRLQLAAEARTENDTRVFSIPPGCLAEIEKDLMPDIRRVATRQGLDEAKLAQIATGLAESWIGQLHFVAADIGIERRLAEIPELQETQFCSLLLQVHAATNTSLNSPNRNIIPTKLTTLRDTLNAAMALLLDRLSGGATDYAILFSKAGVLPMARRIEAMAYDHQGPPGSERDMTDRLAELMGVRGWYQWHNAPSESDNNPKI